MLFFEKKEGTGSSKPCSRTGFFSSSASDENEFHRRDIKGVSPWLVGISRGGCEKNAESGDRLPAMLASPSESFGGGVPSRRVSANFEFFPPSGFGVVSGIEPTPALCDRSCAAPPMEGMFLGEDFKLIDHGIRKNLTSILWFCLGSLWIQQSGAHSQFLF